jgi:deoxyribodipyrimidine photo-lyase
MPIKKEEIVVVWFKRDLRLQDNEALANAINSGKRVLLLYIFEPILLSDRHYSERHWNFIKESIRDLNHKLEPYNTEILVVQSDIITVFNTLLEQYNISKVFSHQETGILVTYERDKNFKRFCKNNLIEWVENINNGVKRGLKNREHWFEEWTSFVTQPLIKVKMDSSNFIAKDELFLLKALFKIPSLKTNSNSNFQKGGTTMAYKYARSFFNERHQSYMHNISKPGLSRRSCSRLSPYISWGNVSVREIYQQAQYFKTKSKHKKHIGAFASRLRWQSHFIQKFEMEHTMEKESINKGYNKLKKNISEAYYKAWIEGKTGFPMVDASMRCLNATGYLNFRMRAMLVSFFTHILWQPWQKASTHLSQMFLDFEPGIHFPQLQMQAGETGINNLRIYNPVKNGLEHDANAEFIKSWVPELSHLETRFVHEPYLMTFLEQQLYDFKIGRDYPIPIVDITSNRKMATDILWKMKKKSTVLKENQRILKKHTLKNRSRMLNSD